MGWVWGGRGAFKGILWHGVHGPHLEERTIQFLPKDRTGNRRTERPWLKEMDVGCWCQNEASSDLVLCPKWHSNKEAILDKCPALYKSRVVPASPYPKSDSGELELPSSWKKHQIQYRGSGEGLLGPYFPQTSHLDFRYSAGAQLGMRSLETWFTACTELTCQATLTCTIKEVFFFCFFFCKPCSCSVDNTAGFSLCFYVRSKSLK